MSVPYSAFFAHARGCSACARAIGSRVYDEIPIEIDKVCETGKGLLDPFAQAKTIPWTPIVPTEYKPPKTW